MAIRERQRLTGFITNKRNVKGSLVVKEKIVGKLSVSTSGITEQYVGDYIVIPKLDQQVLQTKQKVMTDDLTVKEIPVYEVSNNHGGTTIYIAKE